MAARRQSPILVLRNLHNWIKSVLISSNIRPGSVIFDLCCGKGGDLAKLANVKAKLVVHADIAAESVKDAVKRYNEKRMYNTFPSIFIACDCFQTDMTEIFEQRDILFDAVSCQFALHYAFGSRERATRFLRNASACLKPGGVFIATFPDANVLVKNFRESRDGSFGNSVYSVTLESQPRRDEKRGGRLMFPAEAPDSAFGIQYRFSLDDAISDCPEYLVHFPTLVRLAQENGLELIYKKGFHDLFAESVRVPEHLELLQRMKVMQQQAVPRDEWEASYVYMAVVFRKVGQARPTDSDSFPMVPKGPVKESDIIIL